MAHPDCFLTCDLKVPLLTNLLTYSALDVLVFSKKKDEMFSYNRRAQEVQGQARGQGRSETKCTSAMDAYILTVLRRGSLVGAHSAWQIMLC